MKKIFFLKIFIIFIISYSGIFYTFANNRDDITLVKEYLTKLSTLEADFFQISSKTADAVLARPTRPTPRLEI